jgi:hypothetical protein
MGTFDSEIIERRIRRHTEIKGKIKKEFNKISDTMLVLAWKHVPYDGHT